MNRGASARIWASLALAVFGLFAGAAIATSEAAPPPAEAFGRLPDMEGVDLSPSGRYAAAIQHKGDGVGIVVYDLVGGGKPTVIPLTGLKVEYVFWKTDDRMIIVVRIDREFSNIDGTIEFVRVVAVNRDGSNAVVLLNDRLAFKYSGGSDAFVGYLPDDPHHIMMLAYDRGAVNVYKVEIDNGESDRVERGERTTGGFVLDASGLAVLRYDYRGYKRQRMISMRDSVDEYWREILRNDIPDKNDIDPFAIDPERPGIAYALARNGGDRIGVHEMDMRTGQLVRTVQAHARVDVTGTVFDPYTQKLVGVRWTVDAPEVKYFDPQLAKLQADLKVTLTGMTTIVITSWSRDRSRFAVYADSPRHAGIYLIYDAKANELIDFGQRYPELENATLGEVKAISYAARDGTAIPAYLTLPPGKPARNLPLVIFPHGGPHARDTMTFDWWAQFMATRGYAVLQPNFRGSTGYGFNYMQAGFAEWGKRMQDDLTDGVRYLVEQGIADPAKICIVGASYGGYAALAGATMTPELYACAISVSGISDLDTLIGREKRETGGGPLTNDGLARTIGDTSEVDLDPYSPSHRAKEVRAPILLIHGREDKVVNIEQSEFMDNALRRAGKPHEFITLEGEDHYISFGATRTRMLKEVERFLAAHIGG